MTVPPAAYQPIVDNKGVMTLPYMTWTQLVSRNDILTGSGTPEGNVEALQTRLYMDTAGTAGSILYIKRDPDDGAGDKTKGWILV